MQGQGRPAPGGAPSPTVCIPADGVHCRGCRWDTATATCSRPDCPALFTPPALREQQRGWARDPQPQLVVAAGPERSGSTFLYNGLRLLFQHARKPCDAYWLKARGGLPRLSLRVGVSMLRAMPRRAVCPLVCHTPACPACSTCHAHRSASPMLR